MTASDFAPFHAPARAGSRWSGRRAPLGLAIAFALALVLALAALVPASGAQEAEAPVRTPPVPAASAADLAAVLGTLPDGLAPAQIDAIVAVLDDSQARQALRTSLELLSARGGGPAPAPMMARARDRLGVALGVIPDLPALTRAAIARDAAAGYDTGPMGVAVNVGLVVAIALAAAWLARDRLARAARRAAAGASAEAEGDGPPRSPRLARAATVLVADLAGIAVFAAVVVALYFILSPVNPRAPVLLEGVLAVAGLVLLVLAVSRFVLAPRAPERRWLGVSDAAAGAVHGSIAAVMAVAVVFSAPALYARFLDLSLAADLLAKLAFSLAVTATAIVLTWRHRRLVGAALAHSDRPERAAAAGAMAAAAMTLAFAVVWALWSAAQLVQGRNVAVEALASLLVVLLLPAVAGALGRTLPAKVASEGGGKGGGKGGRGLHRALQAVLVLAAIWLILAIWGMDPSAGEGPGAALSRIVFQGGVVVVLGYVGWRFLEGAFDRQIAKARLAPAGSSASRLATLLPLIRAFALAVVATMVILSALSSLGIDIGPLLAGAGVVGLAIGFGAQSLVADIVAGIFFLLDDAFRIGEYVEVGTTRGTVESISLRSLKLRHHRGAVHTLPFGQIHQLTNYSRDWVIMKLEFRVPPETDLALVKKLVKRIGADLAADETLGPSFLEPLKSQGVRRVEDDALIIGVKFMAKPGEQFSIRKEAYQRLVQAFRDNDIDLIARGVTVKVDAAEHVDPKVAAAAAGKTIEETGTGAA
ncbi:MAG: mechanosensitive ion channel family protein [Azospirillaceae bacterium]